MSPAAPATPPSSASSQASTLGLQPVESAEIPQEIDRATRLEYLGLPQERLFDLRTKFNRFKFSIFDEHVFDDIVLESVQAVGAEGVEAELQRRVQENKKRLDDDFDDLRYRVFSDLYDIWPADDVFSLRIFRLMAAESIGAVKSFVAYGLRPLLETRCPEIPSSAVASDRQNSTPDPGLRRRRTRTNPTSSTRQREGARVTVSSSTPSIRRRRSSSEVPLRRSARLAQQVAASSQPRGIRSRISKRRW